MPKVTITSLYLEPDQFVWYQWLCDHKKDYYLLVYIHKRIDCTLWGYKYQHLLQLVGKSQAKRFNYRAHQAILAAKSQSEEYLRR